MPWDALGVLRAKGPPIVGHLRSQNLHRLEGLVGLVPGNQKKNAGETTGQKIFCSEKTVKQNEVSNKIWLYNSNK